MKVFCKECKYLREQTVAVPTTFDCNAPDNIEERKCKDSWRAPGAIYLVHFLMPETINATNDCPWHEEKTE